MNHLGEVELPGIEPGRGFTIAATITLPRHGEMHLVGLKPNPIGPYLLSVLLTLLVGSFWPVKTVPDMMYLVGR